jgi:hypothetical protein
MLKSGKCSAKIKGMNMPTWKKAGKNAKVEKMPKKGKSAKKVLANSQVVRQLGLLQKQISLLFEGLKNHPSYLFHQNREF